MAEKDGRDWEAESMEECKGGTAFEGPSAVTFTVDPNGDTKSHDAAMAAVPSGDSLRDVGAAGGDSTTKDGEKPELGDLSPSDVAFHFLDSTKDMTRDEESEVISLFNKWRKSNPGELDLSNKNLSNAKLKQANLSNINFSNAQLSDANLDEADLNGACLKYAVCDGTSFRGTHFYPATKIFCAYFDNCNWENADFSHFQESEVGTWLSHAALRQPKNLIKEVIDYYIFAQGIVVPSQDARSSLERLPLALDEDFEMKYIEKVVTHATGKEISNITDDEIAFWLLNLTRSGIGGKADVAKASCQFNRWRQKIHPGYLHLMGRSLSGANLSGLDLTNIDFTDAELSGTRLDEADLTGAVLTRALIDGVIFQRAKIYPIAAMQTLFRECDFSEVDCGGTENSAALADALSHSILIKPKNFPLKLALELRKAQGFASFSTAA